jgi:hypothetical protein
VSARVLVSGAGVDQSFPSNDLDFSSVALKGFTATGLPIPGASGTGHVESDLINVYYNFVDFTITGVSEAMAPELDPSNGIAAITLLACCILMLRPVQRHGR